MKKLLKKTVAVLTAVSAISIYAPVCASAAAPLTTVESNAENIYSKWAKNIYSDGNAAFAQYIFKEIFGHEYNVNTTKTSFAINNIGNFYSRVKLGDLVEFKKGTDVYSVVVKSADQNGMTVYEAYDGNNGYIVALTEYDYEKDKPERFMDGRFNGGTYTIYHSKNYDVLNHLHSYNLDGYCSCGAYNGHVPVPVNDKLYVQKRNTPVYKLPYSKSGAVAHLDPSQGGENITAAIINGDNELWYKTDKGWVNEKYLSLTMSTSITQPKTEVIKGVVYGIEKLPVRASNNSSYTITDYIPEGTVINITKKLNSWYKIEFDSKTGYVESRFVELLENSTAAENTTENK